MTVTMLQRPDGSVMRVIDGRWEYLSPLFGEWLSTFTPTRGEQELMQPYPAAINVPDSMRQEFIHQSEHVSPPR